MKAETDCDLQISKDNTFQNNTAFTQGGAVQQKSAYANFEGTVREFGKENPDNKAYEYGPIVGLFPYSIKVFVNNASQDEIEEGVQRWVEYDPSKTIEVASGQSIQVKVDLFDVDSFKVRSDNTTQVKIVEYDDFNNTEVGLPSLNQSIKHNSAECLEGSGVFEDLVIVLKPNETLKFKVEVDLIESNEVVKQFEKEPVYIQINSRRCKQGERFTSKGTCESCPYGRYLLDIADDEGECHMCDRNAYCYGGSDMAPR